MSNGISPYGFNLGNVLMQAEQIKAARQANTLAQQQMQQRAQFQPLLQNYLATQSPEAAQALIAQDPQAAAQIFGAQTAQTGVAAAQMQLSQDEATQTAIAARSVINSKSPKRLLSTAFPGFVEGLRDQQGIDIEDLDDDQVRQLAQGVYEQSAMMAGPEFMRAQGQAPTAEIQTFEAMTAGLSPEQREQARLIELGLEPRTL
jgi:hypothetical protein